MPQIKSPLTENNHTEFEQNIDIEQLKSNYKNDFSVDVNRFFDNIPQLSIYKCKDSGLRFYHPFSVVSDGQFYADLEKNYSGYYNPWRWEHQKAMNFIVAGEKVLEIGCGKGFFLEKLLEIKANPTGLDFNQDAIEQAQKKGITILNETIEQHAHQKTEFYDVVAAFQLFEHVNEVKFFLEHTVKCLKKGGKLIIGVPNNKSIYFKDDTYHTLNLPPHHMLLWDAQSLEFLAKMFDLSIVEIALQPVKKLEKGLIYKVLLNKWLGKNIFSKLVHFFNPIYDKKFANIQK